MKKFHEPIADFIGTGYGSRLQRIDSDVMEDILLTLADRGIPAIGIHDSVRVPESHLKELEQVMRNSSEKIIGIPLDVSLK